MLKKVSRTRLEVNGVQFSQFPFAGRTVPGRGRRWPEPDADHVFVGRGEVLEEATVVFRVDEHVGEREWRRHRVRHTTSVANFVHFQKGWRRITTAYKIN